MTWQFSHNVSNYLLDITTPTPPTPLHVLLLTILCRWGLIAVLVFGLWVFLCFGIVVFVYTDVICIPSLRRCLYCKPDKCYILGIVRLYGNCFIMGTSHTTGASVGEEALIAVIFHWRWWQKRLSILVVFVGGGALFSQSFTFWVRLSILFVPNPDWVRVPVVRKMILSRKRST